MRSSNDEKIREWKGEAEKRASDINGLTSPSDRSIGKVIFPLKLLGQRCPPTVHGKAKQSKAKQSKEKQRKAKKSKEQ